MKRRSGNPAQSRRRPPPPRKNTCFRRRPIPAREGAGTVSYTHLDVYKRQLLDHFHYTFITIGGITMMAAFVFMLLRKDDGDSLLPGRKKPVFETTSSSTPRNP